MTRAIEPSSSWGASGIAAQILRPMTTYDHTWCWGFYPLAESMPSMHVVRSIRLQEHPLFSDSGGAKQSETTSLGSLKRPKLLKLFRKLLTSSKPPKTLIIDSSFMFGVLHQANLLVAMLGRKTRASKCIKGFIFWLYTLKDSKSLWTPTGCCLRRQTANNGMSWRLSLETQWATSNKTLKRGQYFPLPQNAILERYLEDLKNVPE